MRDACDVGYICFVQPLSGKSKTHFALKISASFLISIPVTQFSILSFPPVCSVLLLG